MRPRFRVRNGRRRRPRLDGLTAYTVFNHHRNACLRRASLLLVETDLSVAAVALRCGYSSPSNFCHAFKKHYGRTPRQYRAGRAVAGVREAVS
ncbi:helix-turn-helix transcriptional regulator [Streptomyces sp. NBC_00378]|uniref:helix-turn-helix transcriptional regulator n=1 Tax=unclassified Streptomyces TaxID=2593676 RepID=UPI00224F5DB2|nr:MULTISPECIES: helix-turn-helix transcriptional regulator [unclassified Streptomyces]MCX5109353.1 helix-turn-helix transcriptional regulator [Streptomyces sp. NBC_00378]